jgi:hypothetical protein
MNDRELNGAEPPEPVDHADAIDQRAQRHRHRALEALCEGREGAAIVEALLALEARVEESTLFLAQLR